LEARFGKEALVKHLEEHDYLRQEKLKDFKVMTSGQALAICKWLEFAKTWPDMKWYASDIDSALTYWRTRASTYKGVGS
jgi:hypothetical protein